MTLLPPQSICIYLAPGTLISTQAGASRACEFPASESLLTELFSTTQYMKARKENKFCFLLLYLALFYKLNSSLSPLSLVSRVCVYLKEAINQMIYYC